MQIIMLSSVRIIGLEKNIFQSLDRSEDSRWSDAWKQSWHQTDGALICSYPFWFVCTFCQIIFETC